jgi:hypothetical protein
MYLPRSTLASCACAAPIAMQAVKSAAVRLVMALLS